MTTVNPKVPLFQYVKGGSGKLIGAVAARQDPDTYEIYLGWSKVHPEGWYGDRYVKEKFDKGKARMIAENRCLSDRYPIGHCSRIDFVVVEVGKGMYPQVESQEEAERMYASLASMADRALAYFK